MVPPEEKFERKLNCVFDYKGLDDLHESKQYEPEIDQELLNKVVFGEDRVVEQKMAAANKEISALTTKGHELK